ncbi:MAG: acyltransferase family protein [Bacteroidales bacterium]|nr:acyltransferase family protein [Bacteroidales bacterium]
MSGNSKTGGKQLLYEVSIIRPIIIFLLVVLHSFTIYGGGWELPEGISEQRGYFWFCKLIQGFRIETIALIAGYVFAFQSVVLGKRYDFIPFAIKKIKRLILPCLFFGVIYFFIFKFNPDDFSVLNFLYLMLSGVGHLWFLPLLLCCFLAIWVIDHYRLSSLWLFIGLAILSVMPIPIKFVGGHLQRLFHFLFYCYGGYALYLHKKQILGKLQKNIVIISFVAIYIALTVVNIMFLNPNGFLGNLLQNTVKMLISCSGILALYLFVSKWTEQEDFKPKQWIIESSSLCYGVYIFHQFILIWLYYHTQLPTLCGTYLLPWVGLLISLSVSVIISKLFLKTKFGKFLIG